MSGDSDGRSRAVDVVAEALLARGVDTVFGLLGSGNFPLTRRLVDRGVSAVAARHETGAVVMADAWARSTGRVGVSTLHQGPGVTNALTGLVEAARSRTPMLVVVGEVATTSLHKNQEYDAATAVTDAGAGYVRVLSGETVARDVARAWRDAVANRRPVVLVLPIDVQRHAAVATDEPDVQAILTPIPAARQDDVAAIAAALGSARRPVFVAGRGAVIDGARDAIVELADRSGAILATSAQAHGLFTDHEWSIGICGGFAGPPARLLVSEADLIVSFGASLNHWTSGHGEVITSSPTIIQIDSDPLAFGKHRQVDLPILGGARLTAEAVLDVLPAEPSPGYRAVLGRLGDTGWPVRADVAPAGRVNPAQLAAELDRRLPDDRNVALDGGHFMWFVMRHLRVPDAAAFVFTQNFQSIGLGFASAVGLATARPDRPTVMFTGDGGAMMMLGELDTVAQCASPVLVVVMDDAHAGAELHHFGPEGEPTDLVKFGERDFAGVARALGIPAMTIRSLGDLDGDFARWASDPTGPLLLDCKIDFAVRAEQADLAMRGGA